MTAPKLEWRGVRKAFGDNVVLDGIDVAVETGRSLVIIGGSGQGKSVTIKIAQGLMRPDDGQVLIDGRDVAGRPTAELARQFGTLFQGAALFDSLSVWENVAFRLINADRVPRRQARERALEAMDKVHLPAAAADQRPGELSGGMQKRVGLARAVVAAPEILFFDEPTTGLDPITADVINDLIAGSVRQLGATALSITHDMASVRKIADEVAMLHAGRIVWRGPVADLDRSGSEYVDQFVHGRAEGPIKVAGVGRG